MKVLYMMRKPTDDGPQILREILDESAELIFNADLNEEQREQILPEIDIVVGGRLTDDQLEIAKNLKMQQSYGTGVNRHNLKYFKENGISFCNSHAHAYTIAEYGFSLLHAASKELVSNDQLLRNGDWDYQKYRSFTLHDKTIVFLGFGAIAKSFKKLCEPFNMEYIAVKRTKKCDDPSVKVYLQEERIEALKQADFIFNSLPLTDKTKDFVNKEEFDNMKSTAIIVNVGRGGTINAEAMFEALKERKIKGAAIDVWYNYPENRWGGEQEPMPCYPSEYPFQDLDNILMSGHRAWVTDLSTFEFTKTLIHNVNRFIRGEELKSKVDLDEGY
ncbi:MAG: 2-hydroxyacid dehydrogenase [Candidatus Heimdallarchaeaceae archaeon]|jgi:phosphoglycerate dehydrogenase-like enzyme